MTKPNTTPPDRRDYEPPAWAQVDALTEALAAAEHNASDSRDGEQHYAKRAEAAEARVRELEADVSEAHKAHADAVNAVNVRLATATALIDGIRREYNAAPENTRLNRIGRVLTGQPAALTPDRAVCRDCGRFEHRPGFLGCQPAAPDLSRFDDVHAEPSCYAEQVGLSVGQPAAPTRTVYEVWVGSEKTKERIVKETTDIEDAARLACADLSGCTFWGMKAPTRTDAEHKPVDAFGGCGVATCALCYQARTEAERAVLDACKELSTESLESFGKPASTPWVKFAHAELARRGLR